MRSGVYGWRVMEDDYYLWCQPLFYIENSSDGPIAGLATWHFLRQQVIWEKNMTHTPEQSNQNNLFVPD